MSRRTTLRFTIDVDAEDLIRELESRLKHMAPDRAPSPGRTADPYLTRKETAAMLRVTDRQLDYLRSSGQLGWSKYGRRVLLKRQDVENLMESAYCSAEVSR